MNYRVDVTVTAPVHDTELEDRVARAITTLFPTAEVERADGQLRAETHDLEHLSERLHAQRILDSARAAFFEGRQGDRFSFRLKKQPALHDVANFAVGTGSELGDLQVEVRVHEPDVEAYVDHVAPRTDAEGKPID
ncbi:MAG: RNA-binding domain-containing protein [Halobacteriaceae archaeon]